MPQFSEEDINAAKRRVQEMRNRVSKFTAENTDTVSAAIPVEEKKSADNNMNISDTKTKDKDEEQDKNKYFFVILALIILLSKEGADNTLILALLYLLL